ncbi:phosphatase PAP2 family protein [soil metagenome]
MKSRVRNKARKLVDWLGGVDPLILLVLLVLVGASWAFFEIADEPTGGRIPSMDERILLALRHPENVADPIGPLWFEEAVRDITSLGSVAVLGLVTLAVLGFLSLRRKSQAIGLVLGATLGGQLLSSLLKHWIDRPRPEVVTPLMHASTASFPSGHAMLSAVVYLTLGALLARFLQSRELRLYVLFVSILLTLLVGLSRIYLGVHYPSDVLAGWSIGLAWTLFCWEVARFLQVRGLVEPSIKP